MKIKLPANSAHTGAIARSDNDAAIPVGEALTHKRQGDGDCRGRKMRALAMTENYAGLVMALRRWFDSHAGAHVTHQNDSLRDDQRVDWLRALPYIALHLAVAAVFWVGWSPVALAVAVALYALRMLAITGFYHRYFAHRAFKTSRGMQ